MIGTAMLRALGTLHHEYSLWLALMAALAGLLLAVRWHQRRHSARGLARCLLGHQQPVSRDAQGAFRFAAVVAASVLTIFALTPNGQGTAVLVVATNTPAPAADSQPRQDTIVIIAGATEDIVVSVPGGSTVEIRLREPDGAILDMAPALDRVQLNKTFPAPGPEAQNSARADSE
jgi:hypothetical protein